jgi:hypothetical protein
MFDSFGSAEKGAAFSPLFNRPSLWQRSTAALVAQFKGGSAQSAGPCKRGMRRLAIAVNRNARIL